MQEPVGLPATGSTTSNDQGGESFDLVYCSTIVVTHSRTLQKNFPLGCPVVEESGYSGFQQTADRSWLTAHRYTLCEGPLVLLGVSVDGRRWFPPNPPPELSGS